MRRPGFPNRKRVLGNEQKGGANVHDVPHVAVALGADLSLLEVPDGTGATVWTCMRQGVPTSATRARWAGKEFPKSIEKGGVVPAYAIPHPL